MNALKFISIMQEYKSCPTCNTSWKEESLKCELKDEIIHLYCDCGFSKYVDKNNCTILISQ